MYKRFQGRRSAVAFLSLSLLVLFASKEVKASDSIEGDIENGKALATAKCDYCHGERGVSYDPDTPHLAAQSPAYLLKQLRDYKSRARDDRSMYKRARHLDEQQMADIALWYETQPLPQIEPEAIQELKTPQLVTKGDPARSIPPCDMCHGQDGKTVDGEVPVLAGQHADYLVSTMKSFRDGSRSNDTGGAIQMILKKLSDAEIEALAEYYAALGGRPAE